MEFLERRQNRSSWGSRLGAAVGPLPGLEGRGCGRRGPREPSVSQNVESSARRTPVECPLPSSFPFSAPKPSREAIPSRPGFSYLWFPASMLGVFPTSSAPRAPVGVSGFQSDPQGNFACPAKRPGICAPVKRAAAHVPDIQACLGGGVRLCSKKRAFPRGPDGTCSRWGA